MKDLLQNRVTVAIDKRIARVTLNRPDKRNAVDRGMFEALIDAGESLTADRSIRAVILHGAGDDFCAGIDTSMFAAAEMALPDATDMLPKRASGANFYQGAAMVWRELAVPVIAAVQGAAFGAGLQIALGADMRIAAPDSRWSIMEIRWGIIPDMGISVTGRGLLPPDRLKRLAYTGTIIDGAEAYRQGLVSELAEQPLEAAVTLAGDIASRSPDAVRALKKLIDASRGETAAAALRLEAALQGDLLGSKNQVEAVMANLHKRPADFTDSGT